MSKSQKPKTFYDFQNLKPESGLFYSTPSISLYRAAGILPYALFENQKYFLLALEDRTHKSIVKNRKYGDPIIDFVCLGAFGGKIEKRDNGNPINTAFREFNEETSFYFSSLKHEIKNQMKSNNCPVIWLNQGGYLCYVVEIPFVDPKFILKNNREVKRCVWVPAECLLQMANSPNRKGMIDGEEFTLFSFFNTCLQIKNVKEILC
jgi:hypothetical protein